MSKYPYLYRNSFAEALRCGELGKWRSSHQENITCRKDIEADEQYLPDWAREKLEEIQAPKQSGPTMNM